MIQRLAGDVYLLLELVELRRALLVIGVKSERQAATRFLELLMKD
jgi:hypothetical protein